MHHSGLFQYSTKGHLMNTEPHNAKFLDYNIRSVMINDEPWFVTKDICKVLDIQIQANGKPNAVSATRNLDPDEKALTRVNTNKGIQQLSCVSKSGLCKLIMRSNKKKAKELQDFVISLIPQNAIEALITL